MKIVIFIDMYVQALLKFIRIGCVQEYGPSLVIGNAHQAVLNCVDGPQHSRGSSFSQTTNKVMYSSLLDLAINQRYMTMARPWLISYQAQ